MTSKRHEKSQFHMVSFLVLSWERALEVVVVACPR